MIGSLRKASHFQARITLPSYGNLEHLPFPCSCFCTSSSSSSKNNSFTVFHLINSLGFSRQDAISVSKSIRFQTPEKPDSVFAFFGGHGFSKSQISKIVRSQPQILVSNPEKSLLPKLQFFYSRGASKSDLARIVVSSPALLKRSMENHIIPAYNFLKDFFQSEEMAMGTIIQFSRVLLYDPHAYVEVNINALLEFEVPKSNIATLLRHQPRTFMVKPDHFREILTEVKKMGFDASKLIFVFAVQARRGMSKSTWEMKIETYKRWGWSDEEIRLAFLKSPWCMMLSADKIMGTMDFFVNKMKKASSLIAHRPALLLLSLEKRIIPRYSVVQFLLSKGLIDKEFSLTVVFEPTEKRFLQRFVNAYEDLAPQLLKLYQENVGHSEKQDLLKE